MAMLKKAVLAAVACGAIALTGSAFAQYGAGTGTDKSASAATATHAVTHVRKLVRHTKFTGRSLAGINMREHAITENLNRQQLGEPAAPVAGGRRTSLDLSERQITANLNLEQLGGSTVALGMSQPQIIGPTAMSVDARERQITAQLNRDQMNQALAFNSGTTVEETE